jgi:hypothetical protein
MASQAVSKKVWARAANWKPPLIVARNVLFPEQSKIYESPTPLPAWAPNPYSWHKHKIRSAKSRKRKRLGSGLNISHGSEDQGLPDPKLMAVHEIPGYCYRAAVNQVSNYRFWSQMAERVVKIKDIVQIGDLAAIADAFVSANHKDETMLAKLPREFIQDADRMTFDEAVVVAHFYAHFRTESPTLMAALSTQACKTMANVDAQSIAVLMAAFSSFGKVCLELCSTALRTLLSRPNQDLPTQFVVAILTSVAVGRTTTDSLLPEDVFVIGLCIDLLDRIGEIATNSKEDELPLADIGSACRVGLNLGIFQGDSHVITRPELDELNNTLSDAAYALLSAAAPRLEGLLSRENVPPVPASSSPDVVTCQQQEETARPASKLGGAWESSTDTGVVFEGGFGFRSGKIWPAFKEPIPAPQGWKQAQAWHTGVAAAQGAESMRPFTSAAAGNVFTVDSAFTFDDEAALREEDDEDDTGDPKELTFTASGTTRAADADDQYSASDSLYVRAWLKDQEMPIRPFANFDKNASKVSSLLCDSVQPILLTAYRCKLVAPKVDLIDGKDASSTAQDSPKPRVMSAGLPVLRKHMAGMNVPSIVEMYIQ